MRIYADLQIHSRFSGATSEKMTLREIAYFARLKGLNLVGTGDALHPGWLKELKTELTQLADSGFYTLRDESSTPLFVCQTEIATVHEYDKKTRRIHHVILMPSLEIAEQLSEILNKFGDISADGRPVLNISPAEAVEVVMGLSKYNFIFPAHAWTPWWSIFGAIGGVNRIEECYEDMTRYIYAIETGLSSDPPMNWRISWLDRYILLSSSDSHSPYPFRLGREAVVFELKRPNYQEMIEAMRNRDASKVLMTLEVPPSYGKYHWSGHRRCGVGPIPPSEAQKLNYRCPKCGRRLTKGVEDRVEELADREMGYRPKGAIDFKYILPLQELIALSLGIDYTIESRLQSKKIWDIYIKLVNKLGPEYEILLNIPLNEIASIGGHGIAELIRKMRSNELKIIPGFDGVYGKLIINEKNAYSRQHRKNVTDHQLEDYFA
ncbi:MAG: endonuclease Q family protein [Nitrososphaerota archaeon]